MVGNYNYGTGVVPTIPLATGYNNSGWGGFGGSGDGWWGIILLALLFGWGNGGYGGFGGCGNNCVTEAQLCSGFNFNNLENGVRGVQQGICDSTYALNNSIMSGFHGVDNALCSGFNNVNNNITEARFDAQKCCCETNRNIDAVRYENAKNTCDIIQAGHNDADKIIAYLTNEKISALQTELQSAQLALQNNAQTQTLINALKPTPIPAYITCSPYQAANFGFGFGNSCGCGCGSNLFA